MCILIITQTKGKNIDWLNLIPLYHLLLFNKEPFMEPPRDHNIINWKFWDVLKENRSRFQEYVRQSKYKRLLILSFLSHLLHLV